MLPLINTVRTRTHGRILTHGLVHGGGEEEEGWVEVEKATEIRLYT